MDKVELKSRDLFESFGIGIEHREIYMKKRSGHLILWVLFLSFASEIVHGILTHELGTSDYAPFAVGEVVRGPIFILVVGYTFLKSRYQSNFILVFTLLSMSFWIGIQALFFQFTISEAIGTFMLGLRWLYLFFLLNYFLSYIRRNCISADTIVSQVKWIILIFYCIPILLSAAGIAGYTVYGDASSRKGYAGFVMNSNVVASTLVIMLPFFLKFERLRDVLIFFVYLGSAVLLGSKLTWISFAGILGMWLVYRVILTIKHILRRGLRIRRKTFTLLAFLVVIVIVLPFTPITTKVVGIYTGLVNLYGFYVDGNAFGLQSNVVDVITSQRTRRVQQLLNWAVQPDNTLMLLIGGGLPNYKRLTGEVDWIDLTALFGLFGVVIFYSVILFLLFRVYKFHRSYYAEVLSMLILTLMVSLVSGHTFITPVIGTTLAAVLGAFFGSPVVNTAHVQLPSKVSTNQPEPIQQVNRGDRANQQTMGGNL